MIHRVILTVLAVMLLPAAVLFSQDEEPALTPPSDGVMLTVAEGPSAVTVDGHIKLAWLQRDDTLNFADFGASTSSTQGYTGQVTMGIGIDFDELVSARIEMENVNRDDTGINYFGGGNNAGNSQEWTLEQAFIDLKGLFSENLNIRIGVQDFVRKLRPEDSGSFYADLSHNGWPKVANLVSVYDRPATNNGFHGNADPTGILFSYLNDLNDPRWVFEFVHFIMREQVVPGDPNDLTFTGGFFRYMGEKDWNLDLSIINWHGQASMDMYSIGIGFFGRSIADMNGLDPFVEFHQEMGDFNRRIDAAGSAFRLGARYRFENNENDPWVEVSYWSASGDGDGTDTDADGFISAQSFHELMLIESADYGLNMNSNYNSFRIGAGISTTLNVTGAPEANNNVHFTVRIGFLELDEAVANEDNLGTEIDLWADWELTGSLKIFSVIAFLTGSDVLEDVLTVANADVQDDSTHLILFGTELGF